MAAPDSTPGTAVGLFRAGRSTAIVAVTLALGAASADVDLAALASYENRPVTKIELTGHSVTREYVITRELQTGGQPLQGRDRGCRR